ncbi:MAG: CZB domain-containing protein [Magnetococcales bacterium]|nr:CZB domain-containing protein [Magnetococcales bacterium]
MTNEPPRCSLPGGERGSQSASSLVSHHDCALGQWCEKEGQQSLGSSQDFQELQRIHAQLHWIAKEIVWYNEVSGSSIGISAMEHFNDLWQQLTQKRQRISQIYQQSNHRQTFKKSHSGLRKREVDY